MPQRLRRDTSPPSPVTPAAYGAFGLAALPARFPFFGASQRSLSGIAMPNFRNFANDVKDDAEFAGALETLKKKMLAKQEKLDAAARALLVPVKHTIKVEALK